MLQIKVMDTCVMVERHDMSRIVAIEATRLAVMMMDGKKPDRMINVLRDPKFLCRTAAGNGIKEDVSR
jgi:hypothetical protein